MDATERQNGDAQVLLPAATWLVIFEYLSRSYEVWRERVGPDASEDSFVLLAPESGERVALWHLEGAIERTLPEVFSAQYKQIISEQKRNLAASSGALKSDKS